MAINFAILKELIIPEGNVTKIIDINSNVLWEKIKYIETTPSQSNSLTYTGSTLTPTWSNYDSTQLTIGGTTSSVNAGIYTATFTPKDGYCWSDGSNTEKSVSWSIAKAAGSLSISPTNLSLDRGKSGTITVTKLGDGIINAVSDNNYAVVTIDNNLIFIKNTYRGNREFNGYITISVSEGTNYTAPQSQQCRIRLIGDDE